MNFKFLVDKDYLLLKMISNRNNIEELNQWKNSIINHVFDKNTIDEIEKRQEIIEEYFINGEWNWYVLKNNLNKKVNKIMNDELFLKYYNETLKYSSLINTNWLRDQNKINNWLKEKIKISIKKNLISVYISHPKLNVGKCVNQENIFFGHWKGLDDVNYNIVYLCHENLHSFLPSDTCMPPAMKLYYDKNDNISNQEHWKNLNSSIENYYKIYDFEFDVIHAVIELISDNELYTILSHENKYEEGHENLKDYKKLILPFWFEYLSLSDFEIEERLPNFSQTNSILLNKNDKSNIENFINFLINSSYLKKKFEVPDLIYKTPKI